MHLWMKVSPSHRHLSRSYDVTINPVSARELISLTSVHVKCWQVRDTLTTARGIPSPSLQERRQCYGICNLDNHCLKTPASQLLCWSKRRQRREIALSLMASSLWPLAAPKSSGTAVPQEGSLRSPERRALRTFSSNLAGGMRGNLRGCFGTPTPEFDI